MYHQSYRQQLSTKIYGRGKVVALTEYSRPLAVEGLFFIREIPVLDEHICGFDWPVRNRWFQIGPQSNKFHNPAV